MTRREKAPVGEPRDAAGSLRSLTALRAAVASCRGCDLWETATQAVAGEGPATTDLMLVGEQPGDQEDRQGHPFVGPAGRLLDDALEQAGIDRSRVYVSNVVKHFAWKPRGKRRIHRPPSADEIRACHPWLEAELRLVRPDVLVCLGASAARSVLRRRTTHLRGPRRAGRHRPRRHGLRDRASVLDPADGSARPRGGDARSGGRSAQGRRSTVLSVSRALA
jgi:uracil-DNA glycosylase